MKSKQLIEAEEKVVNLQRELEEVQSNIAKLTRSNQDLLEKGEEIKRLVTLLLIPPPHIDSHKFLLVDPKVTIQFFLLHQTITIYQLLSLILN